VALPMSRSALDVVCPEPGEKTFLSRAEFARASLCAPCVDTSRFTRHMGVNQWGLKPGLDKCRTVLDTGLCKKVNDDRSWPV
jgi:hypothetical protein